MFPLMVRLVLPAAMVFISVCGGSASAPAARPASPAPIPVSSDTFVPTATPNPAEGYLAYLTDYQYTLVPATTEKQVSQAFEAAKSNGDATAIAVRSVTKGHDATGLLLLVIALNPALANLPNAREAMEGSMTVPHTQIYVDGRPASYFADLGGIAAIAWLHQTFYVVVYGADRPTIERFAESLIFANGGVIRGPAPAGSVSVDPLKAGAPVILAARIVNGPSLATFRCRYVIDGKGTSQSIVVTLNVDGAGSCVADFRSTEATVRGHVVMFLISRDDGTEFGQATIVVPK